MSFPSATFSRFRSPNRKSLGVEKLTGCSLKGFFFVNRALFAYRNGRFASSLLLLGIGVSQASKKAIFSFKSPSPKPHFHSQNFMPKTL